MSMNKAILAFGAFLAITNATACGTKPAIEAKGILTIPSDTIREDRLSNSIVIKGAALTPEFVDNNTVCFFSNLGMIDIPDSEVIALVDVNDGRLITSDKNDIFRIFPDAMEVEIDGKTLTRKEFMEIPSSMIKSVTFADGKLTAAVMQDVNGINEASREFFSSTRDWSMAQMERSAFGATFEKYADVVLNDLSTYPVAGINLSVDCLAHSLDYAKKLKPEAIRGISWLVSGDIVNVNIYTKNYEYYSLNPVNKYYEEGAMPNLAFKNIIGSSDIPVNEINSVILLDNGHYLVSSLTYNGPINR